MSNVDFFNLQSSITALERALGDATNQKTVRKGARTSSSIHEPIPKLQANVEEDLGIVLNSPLRPARGSGYGCLPLEAVQPVRRLHEMLWRTVGPSGDPDMLNDRDTAADLHHRVQALVASVDSDHPFLKVELEGEGDDEEPQPTPKAKGKGKKVADDEPQPTPKAKGKGKKVVGPPQAPTPTPVDGDRRSARILARRAQTLADRRGDDLDDVEPNEDGDGDEEPLPPLDSKAERDDDDFRFSGSGGDDEDEDGDEDGDEDLDDLRMGEGKGKGAGPSRRPGAGGAGPSHKPAAGVGPQGHHDDTFDGIEPDPAYEAWLANLFKDEQ